jgi:hypothetical protein
MRRIGCRLRSQRWRALSPPPPTHEWKSIEKAIPGQRGVCSPDLLLSNHRWGAKLEGPSTAAT